MGLDDQQCMGARKKEESGIPIWVARWAYLFSGLEPGWESCLREHTFSLDLPSFGKGCTPWVPRETTGTN